MANTLIHETSPYLLQHANNPVDWHPWNETTLNQAKEQGKMLIVSIGYAACHWCHVMERESFEDKEVAQLMNEHFLCIKVDREERPDVDQIYMDAAQLINGNAGWPLNALALADGRPYFAGTYFPKKNWMELLNYFIQINKETPEKLVRQAEQITAGIAQIDAVFSTINVSFSKADIEKMVEHILQQTDKKWGGLQGNMKFPMPSIWEFLLESLYFFQSQETKDAVFLTLDKIAKGGIYDHIEGGFFRYSTDPEWNVPHFEKMLYDNAALVSLYSHAYQLEPKELYRDTVFQTLDFVANKLTNANGAFYSSLDADSEGIEGKYYVWKKEEINKILGEKSEAFCTHFGITETGNWENGENIPDVNFGRIQPNFSKQEIESCKEKILSEREKRIPPATDNKIITSWNTLMAKAFLDAYSAFNEQLFLDCAEKNIEFLLENVVKADGLVMRNFNENKSAIPGFLDDYAFLISALIKLYQTNFEEKYLLKALEIYKYVCTHFSDEANSLFFYTHQHHHQLIVRKKEITDNVIVSSNSEMAKISLRLGHYFENENYKKRARQMIETIFEQIKKYPAYHANWGIAANKIIFPLYEIAITGKDAQTILQQFNKHFLPQVIFMGGNSSSLPLMKEKQNDNETLIYVCQNKVCQLPVANVDAALRQIKMN